MQPTTQLSKNTAHTFEQLQTTYGAKALLITHVGDKTGHQPEQIKILAYSKDNQFLKVEMNTEKFRWFHKDMEVVLLSDMLF